MKAYTHSDDGCACVYFSVCYNKSLTYIVYWWTNKSEYLILAALYTENITQQLKIVKQIKTL